MIPYIMTHIPPVLPGPAFTGTPPKMYGQYLLNKRGYSHKRTNK